MGPRMGEDTGGGTARTLEPMDTGGGTARTLEPMDGSPHARGHGRGERAVREPPLREREEGGRWRDSSTPLRYAQNEMLVEGRCGRDSM